MIVRSRAELDLLDRAAVQRFMQAEKPDAVILAAAKVGGIHANNAYPADFIFENLMIECNVIRSAFEAGIRKLLFLGSSCIYPRDAAQPLVEEALLSGPLEPTNEAYAIAKIAGIKLATATTASMTPTTGPSCPRTSMGRMTNSTQKTRTSCPP